MIDRPGIIQDVQAMAKMAYLLAQSVRYQGPQWIRQWARALDFHDDCIAFARDLEQREAPLMQVWKNGRAMNQSKKYLMR